MAHRLQEYHYEVPYLKMDTDLWAQAAVSELDDFKAHFKDGRFFDPEIKDHAVADYLRLRLEEEAAKSGVAVKEEQKGDKGGSRSV